MHSGWQAPRIRDKVVYKSLSEPVIKVFANGPPPNPPPNPPRCFLRHAGWLSIKSRLQQELRQTRIVVMAFPPEPPPFFAPCSLAFREKLQLLQPLQYCRKISSNYCEPSRIAEREKLELLEPLLYCGDRNCNYCDPSSMAERDKLQLLRPLQYCREIRVRAPHDRVASQWYDPMDRRRTGSERSSIDACVCI